MTDFAKDGLWANNPALVQALGLCPLLAVSNSVVNALALGLATLLVLVLSSSTVSLVRNTVPDMLRLPIFVIIIASLTTIVEYLMQALSFDLYLALGIFLPLITTNCLVLGRSEAFAKKVPFKEAFLDAFWMGLGFLWVLVLLGGIRELLANGTLFSNMDLLFGDIAQAIEITISNTSQHFLLIALPPGGFIILGFMVAAKNAINARSNIKAAASKQPIKL